MAFGLRRAKIGQLPLQLVSKISNLCGPDPPTSQTDGRTDGRPDRQTDERHAISIPRVARQKRMKIICRQLAMKIKAN